MQSFPHFHIHTLSHSFGGQGWIRTTELRRGQIYSLLPLATWLLAPKKSNCQKLYPIFKPEPLVGIEPTTY